MHLSLRHLWRARLFDQLGLPLCAAAERRMAITRLT
jgi:hypothetical protein